MRVRAAEERDAEALARVHVAVWRQTYAGMMPDEYLAGLSVERRATMWAARLRGEGPPDTQVYVADDPAHGIVGFAVAGRERTGNPEFDGELWAINIDAAHHRRGVGRALVLPAAQWLAGKGFRAMMLWVVAANPARGFYERLGGKLLAQTRPATFGNVTVPEVAYGWRSLAELIARLESEAPR
jgi:GNAT superfamily N-acetyltransferase